MQLRDRDAAGGIEQPMVGHHPAEARPRREQPVGVSIGCDGVLGRMCRIADRATTHASVEINRLQISFESEQQIADLPIEPAFQPGNEAGRIDGLHARGSYGRRP